MPTHNERLSGLDARFLKIEPREIPQDLRAWLGGAFEAGGSITIDSAGRGHTYPRISIGDNSPILAFRISEELGGSVSQEFRHKTWRWVLKGYAAAQTISQMEDFSPSRKAIVKAVREWMEAFSIEERTRIAVQARENASIPPATEEYKEVLRNPYFLAGAVDARGAVYSSGKKNPTLYLHSLNEALIDALVKNFGGAKRVLPKSGSVSFIDGKPVAYTRDIIHWEMGEEATKNLVQLVKPYLLTGRVKGEQALRY